MQWKPKNDNSSDDLIALADELNSRRIESAADTRGDLLSNLLAVIHRDGGHYEDEHGTEKAVEDAMDVVIGLRELQDQA